MHSIYIGQLMRPAAALLIMHMGARLGGVAIICDYLHPVWGDYLKWKMVYYFKNHFFIRLHYSRTHCVRFYSTEGLNVVQNT